MRLFGLLVLVQLGWAQKMVLIGGSLGDNQVNIWGKIIEMAGGEGVAKIGIVTAASATPVDSAVYYRERFLNFGANETYWIPVHEGDTGANSDPDVVAEVNRMTGFMFGGGDQARIINSFYNAPGRTESPVLAAMRAVYQGGAVMAGTSAGSAAMPSAVMIMGGMSYEACLSGAYVYGDEPGVDDLTYDPDGGIGMLDNYLIDSHFSERGREGRLVRLVSDTMSGPNGAQFGIGIDEGTAFAISDVGTPQSTGEVIGQGGVFIADLSRATVDSTNLCWRIINVYGHYLTEDDTFNLFDHTVTWASWKTNTIGNEYYDNAVQSDAIFNGNRGGLHSKPEFPWVATNLFDSRLDTNTLGTTEAKNPMYQVDFIQEGGSQSYGEYSQTNPTVFLISYYDLNIEMAASAGDETNNKCRQVPL